MIHDAYLYKNLLSTYINDYGLDFTLIETDWNKDKILKKIIVSFYNATKIFFGIYYLASYLFLQQVYLISQKFVLHRYDDILESIIYEIESK